VLTSDEARELAELRDLVARVIAVDDFAAEELAASQAPSTPKPQEHPSPKPEHIAAE
jgi:acyl-CoA dehydrogenase